MNTQADRAMRMDDSGPHQSDEEDAAVTAEQLMNRHPVVLRDTDTIGTAAEQIMSHRFRSLPVVDQEGRFLGILGVSCMLRLVLPKAATLKKGLTGLPYLSNSLEDLRERLDSVIDEPVTVCLDPDVPVVHPDTPMLETLLTLYRTKTALGVVEEDTRRLLGVISYFDVGERIMAESGPTAEIPRTSASRSPRNELNDAPDLR
ncbi:MAG: CBS domain-containing protein [Gammaproteobacteria bacterium]|nr:CBS domain-containing protein [Gammaproteobacteria bacterium]